MVTADAQLQLRWHSHTSTFTSMLADLHNAANFSDVVLSCQGGHVEAHRAILSLCSPYLANVLTSLPHDGPATLLLPDIPAKDVVYLMSFIYCGQVDVPQTNIASFLNTGKLLQVLGLEQGDRLVASPEPSDGTTSTSPSDTEDETGSVCSQPRTSATPPPHSSSDVNDNVTPNKENKDLILKQEQASPTHLPLDPNVLIKEEHVSPAKEEQMTLPTIFSAVPQHNSDHKDQPPQQPQVPPTLPPAPPISSIIGSDGRIDLNYYLQQAIQCASMPCPLCKKEFRSQSGLRDHIRLHTGERPFICEYCHMNFARASHLKRHRRMHTGEKPFQCNMCSKEFSRGDKLKDHLKRHEAEEKLNKIRSQIFNPEDCSSEDSSAVANRGGMAGPVSPSIRSDGAGGGNIGTSSMSISETMAHLVAKANPLAVTPDSIMSAKTTAAANSLKQQLSLQPPAKRRKSSGSGMALPSSGAGGASSVITSGSSASNGGLLPQMFSSVIVLAWDE